MPLGMAALAELGMLVWWLGYYPGLLAYDSIDYTWEVTTGHWVDDHSIAYDGAVWLSLQLTGDYALLTLAQTITMAFIIGYLAAGLRKFRVPTGWTVAGTVLFAALPTSGAFIVWVWKDVPYVLGGALACAGLVHLMADALRTRRYDRYTGLRRDWWMVGVGLMTVCLARNNGFLAVALTGLVLLALLRRLWRRIAAVALVPVVMFFVLDSGVYPALGVTKPVNYAGDSFFYADVAYAYAKAPSTFTHAELAVMSKVATLKHWSTAGADCRGTDGLTSTRFNLTEATRINSQLTGIFAKVVERTPQFVAEATICRGQPAWAIFPGSDPIYVPGTGWDSVLYGMAIGHPDLYTSKFHPAMVPHHPSATLHRLVDWWYNLLTVQQLRWLLWGGAVWCWIAYGLLFRLSRRLGGRWEVLAIGAATAGLQITVFVAIPGALYRYMAGPTIIGVLLLPIAFSRLTRKDLPLGGASDEAAAP